MSPGKRASRPAVRSRVDPLRYLPDGGDAPTDAPRSNRRLVAVALLCHPKGPVLLQHRDDLPGVIERGKWSLFGGGLEPGEDADTALLRELQEEIGFTPAAYQPFVTFQGRTAVIHVYLAQIAAPLEALDLQEGQGFAYVEADQALASYDLAPLARAALEMLQSYRRFRAREGLTLTLD